MIRTTPDFARARRAVIDTLERRVLLATVPAGFVDTNNWVSGLGNTATAMEFAPDGRLFITQQTGQLRIAKPNATGSAATLLTTPFVTLNVDSVGERGLLSVEFDPNFLANGYVYLYYTVPNGPDGSAGAHNRVSRFTAVDANPDPNVYAPGDTAQAGSELILMELDPLSDRTNHNGGAIHFGLDGKLYVAVGENANPSNAQSMTNRLGKMLRINPDGSIPADNPFYNTAAGANRAIWARGLRNPYTFAVQPGTGRIFINDVGQSSWEEVNEGRAGANYGWPATEGDFNPTQFPQYTRPVHAYPRNVGTVITGGAFYNPAVQNFPSAYLGDYFFADNGSGWVHKLEAPISGNGLAASNFASGINGPVDLDVGPDGALYYLARFVGRVGRIRFGDPASLAPSITGQPVSQTVDAGSPATFTVTANGDGALAYRWQRQEPRGTEFVDVPGAGGASYTLQSPTAADTGAQYRVVVTNAFGSATSDPATLTVNPAPQLRVENRWVFYNDSAFDGSDPAATEADDGAIATDKRALLPGEGATFANVTSYARGLNGIMIDVFNMTPDTPIDADNFLFRVGSGDGTWEAAPAPASITVRGLPTGAIRSRVTVTWADGAIQNEWLQVVFNPSGTPAVGGPSGGDVFYVGNLVGETGDPATSGATRLRVTALDLAGLRAALTTQPVPVTNRFDLNRDAQVNALDLALIRRSLFVQLPLITAPPPPMGPAAAALAPLWADGSDDPLA